MNKVVKLSVHKNTKHRRELRQLKKEAVQIAKECLDTEDIVGYAFVVFKKNGNTRTGFHADGKHINGVDVPKLAKRAIKDRYLQSIVE